MVKLYVPPPSQTVTIPSILFQIVELEDTTEDEVELEILTAAVEGALRECQLRNHHTRFTRVFSWLLPAET
jgi:hypothetical protein